MEKDLAEIVTEELSGNSEMPEGKIISARVEKDSRIPQVSRKGPFSKTINILTLVVLLVALPLTIFLVQKQQDIRRPAAEPTIINDNPVTKSIFLLIYNPIIESRGSVDLITLMNWNDPDAITNNIASTLHSSSNNYITYTVQERQEIDGYPILPDGFQYNDETFLNCLNNRSTCHQPNIIDYARLFSDYNICTKTIDEVWLWGGPEFGFAEYQPASYCGKTTFVMGFNYERTLGEALEDFGHRTEYVLDRRIGVDSDWGTFKQPDGHCGGIHYPPGTLVPQEEYMFNKTTPTLSDCDGYLSYPTGPFIMQEISCYNWGCSAAGYFQWWFGHLPHNTGTSVNPITGQRIYNNWWKYYAFFDETAAGIPVPGSSITKITSGQDDVDFGCYFESNKNEVYIGKDDRCQPIALYNAGFRFLNIAIPKGAVIQSAYIEFLADGPYDNAVNVEIRGENTGNALPFSSTHEPKGMAKTSAAVPWSITEPWTTAQLKRTPDFSPVIQEIVNRGDWAQGNNITIILDTITASDQPKNHRRLFGYEREPNEATRLIVEFAEPPAVTPTPTPTPTPSPTPTPVPAITPTPSPSLTTMTVSNISMTYSIKGPNIDISTRVTVVDKNTNQPVSSATVDLKITTPSGKTNQFSASTKNTGTAGFSLRSKEKGIYTATVTNVTKGGYTYSPTNTTKTLTVP